MVEAVTDSFVFKIRALFNTFERFYRFSPARVILIFFLMLIQGVSSGVGLLFIVPLIELLGIQSFTETDNGIVNFARYFYNFFGIPIRLESILLTYVVIVTLIASAQFLLSYESSKIQQSYIRHVRDGLYRPLLNARWQFIVDNRLSDFIHCLTVQVQKAGVAMTLFVNFLSQLSLVCIVLVFAFLISWKITLVATVFLMMLLLLLLPLNRLVYHSGVKQERTFKSIFRMLSDHLASLKIIKSYLAEKHYADLVVSSGVSLAKHQVRLAKINALTQWLYIVAAACTFAVFFYVSQNLFLLSLTKTILFLVIVARMIPQISGLQKNYQQLLHVLPVFNDIENVRKQILSDQEQYTETDAVMRFERVLTLDEIAYQYSSSDNLALKNINIVIEKNEVIALTGQSGAGKSTLADIIAGLLVPSHGCMACDGNEINDLNRGAWRKNIAYVTQDTFLFNDSVRENLAWACPVPPLEEDVWQALHLVAANDFVSRLPDQLDTMVGDRGVRLSGGERQRLGLARALLSNREILILDEATSALDDKNERFIQQAIERLKGRLTIIIIAHRQSTIAMADRCIYLDHGCLQVAGALKTG